MSMLWKLPISSYTRVSSDYGTRINPTDPSKGTQHHDGVDFAAPAGTPILAASSGEVIRSDWHSNGFGYHVRIDHGNGIISIYGHASRLLVSKGQRVSAGDIIAEVGTTGNSTGNHLHFQVNVNGSPQDPKKFISYSGGDNIVSDIDYQSDSTGETSYIYSTYELDATGTTTGQRVSGNTTQPVHAFVNIYIGEDLIPLATNPAKPNIVQSFEYNRLQDSGESASFVLFDDNWDEIEKVLSANFDRIYVEYGYHGTGLKSKIIRHRMTNYTVSFNSTGAILSLSSVTEGSLDNLKPRSIPLETRNPTEAVKEICKALGYTVLDENFDESQDISSEDPFNLVEYYPLTYIKEIILPQAAQVNEEIFTFNVDSNGVAYFKRRSYATSSATDSMRTYIYQKGYDSLVKDINFDIKGVFGGSDFEIATGYRVALFDTENKSQESYSIDKSAAVTTATGDTTHTNSGQSNPVVDSAGYTASQMKNKLYYYMKHLRSEAYEATMTIVGDPTIELLQNIRIINVTDKGLLHHTSGVYQILGITDSIQGGEMITTLKLVRNGLYNIDGVEIINPKALIK